MFYARLKTTLGAFSFHQYLSGGKMMNVVDCSARSQLCSNPWLGPSQSHGRAGVVCWCQKPPAATAMKQILSVHLSWSLHCIWISLILFYYSLNMPLHCCHSHYYTTRLPARANKICFVLMMMESWRWGKYILQCCWQLMVLTAKSALISELNTSS